MRLKNKVAVITGSSRGIGRAIALRFASEGAKVVVNYIRNSRAAEEVLKIIKANNGVAIAVKADVSNPQDVKRLFREAVKRFGTVDILVNNAGILVSKDFFNLTPKDIEKTISVNTIAALLCAQEAAKIMLPKKSGKIINVSSVRGLEHHGRIGSIDYAISKAGMINLTGSLAKRLAPYINVNSVAPGVVQSGQTANLDPKIRKEFIDATYLKRFIRPEEIAAACLFLASEDSSAMTGHTMVVDAGFQLK